MNRNMTLVLFAFSFLVFSSCSTTIRKFSHIPDEYLGSEYSSELGKVSSSVELFLSEERYNFLRGYLLPQSVFPFQYENYSIRIFITDQVPEYSHSNVDTMLYMHIDECRIILPSGSAIDLLDSNNIIVNYSYTGRDYVIKAPPKTLLNVQPQYAEDGRKILYLDSVVDNDAVWIEFNAMIPSSAQFFRIEYSLTIVWENLDEVKAHHNLLFRKKIIKTSLFTV